MAFDGTRYSPHHCYPRQCAVGDPLLALDNLITSPHVAGVTLEASIRMATGAARNVLAAFDGTLDPAVVVNAEVLSVAARA